MTRVETSRWWFFGGELVFYLGCMLVYLRFWERACAWRWLHRLVAIFAATNLLYHFPPLFTMLSLMSHRPELSDAVLDRALYVELFTASETLARVVHHWLSSLATVAVLAMVVAEKFVARSTPAAAPEAAPRPSCPPCPPSVWAARVALVATALQLPVGLWVLLASPEQVQSDLLGGETTSTILFGSAVVLAVLLLERLTQASLGETSRRLTAQAAVLLLAVVLLMSGAQLHSTRAAATVRNRAADLRSPASKVVLRDRRLGNSARPALNADVGLDYIGGNPRANTSHLKPRLFRLC